MENAEITEILDGSQLAIKEMDNVYEAHRQMETVVISPDSWVGKELLSQSKRLTWQSPSIAWRAG
jgi:hypothetical protein